MTRTLNPADIERIKRYLPARVAEAVGTRITPNQSATLNQNLQALRQGISAYLPRYLVEMVVSKPEPGQTGCFFKQGTVIFADVSGFTAMSEKLAALGKEGAEEMTGIVNAYFEAMLEISEGLGGDLLKFGGDALMIFFEGQHGAGLALTAGTSMQTAMSRFEAVQTSQGEFPLRMSIGMATGPIILVHLLIAEEMHYTVMGRTLTRMARRQDRATAGQIVVDQATALGAAQKAIFQELEEGYYLLEELKVEEEIADRNHQAQKEPAVGHRSDILGELQLLDALSLYLPEELLVRLVANPSHPMRRGSHRPVTKMFANFIGLDEILEDLGPGRAHECLAVADAYFKPIGQVLERYESTVSRLDNYSVGQRIFALFGALQAHEDDPERAVRAAAEMNLALDLINDEIRSILSGVPGGEQWSNPVAVKQRIGINTGFVFAGSVGSSKRREYTVMGAQVNLTARLMSLAKEGQVLIGDSTARHVERLYTLEEQDAVKVKGISEPVPNFVVGDEIAEGDRLSSLVRTSIQGREQELRESRQVVEAVVGGQGRMLVISGDSGIGKSRLIDEIVAEAPMRGLAVINGACLSYGRSMTYHPWAEILRRLFGIDPGQDKEERIKVLSKYMESIGQALFTPLIGQVMGLSIEDNDLTRDLDAKLRRQRVLDLVLQLLQDRANQRPLLVLIEDAHWADDASRDLIDYVGRNIGTHPILFLLSHRPDEDLPEWGALPDAHTLPLSGLSSEACLALARQILGDQPLSAHLKAFVLEKGGGNPLFLGEVIRNLLEADSLIRDAEGVWDLPEGVETVDLPDTIHGMIISRMDRLDPSDRRMLQVASVEGRSFTMPTIAGVYEFDQTGVELTARVMQLTTKGLVEPTDDGEGAFRFTHLTTQEVVYESLSYELRRDLHSRIGSHYETTYADSLSEWVDLLAYHYYEGHAWPKATSFNLQAGQRAQREYANAGAISALQKALFAADKLGTHDKVSMAKLPAHETLGGVYALVGEYDEALENYREALEMVDTLPASDDQQVLRADLHGKIAEVHERRSEFETAFDWLERGFAFLQGAEPSIVAARMRMLGGGIYRRLGKLEQAAMWCQESLEIASTIETREAAKAVAHANYSLSGIYWRLGDFERAVELSRKSLEIFTEVEDVIGQARAYTNLSNAYADLGDWDRAMEALERSLEINERIGNIVSVGFVTNNMATIHLDRGEWQEAYELYQTSREIWVKLGASMQEAITLSNLAQVYIYQENWPEAEGSLIESKHIFETLGSEDYLPEVERRWAELYLRTGNLDAACSHALQATELATTLEARLDLGIALRILGEIYLAQGGLEAAEGSLLRSGRILRDLESEYEAAKVTIPMAALVMVKGETPDIAALQAARSTFERLGAQYDLERTEDLLDQINQ